MRISTKVHRYFALSFWNLLPIPAQKLLSIIWTYFYKTRFSSLLVFPFAKHYNLTAPKLSKYRPASGALKYLSFQDFFTRQLSTELIIHGNSILPCEGAVCENGLVGDLDQIQVKGHFFSVRNIFGDAGSNIPDHYSFINIFLHNHNYHRFHAPVSGTIKSLRAIPGQLNFLRPWLYKSGMVSQPAFVNERVVLEVVDANQQSWFISFVGGMGVGQIKIHPQFEVGQRMTCGEEIGLFLLGSTCCLAIPKAIKTYKYLEKVSVGDAF